MTDTSHISEPASGKAESRRQKRRQAILASARSVFLEQGFEAASMSEIVDRAGGSLTTLYSLFGDKKGLFFAMLEDRLQNVTSEMSLQLIEHTPIRVGLTRIGRHFITATMESDSVEIYRLIIGLAPRFPEIAKAFMEQGPDQVRLHLANYLTDRHMAGEIQIDDARACASLFLEMVRSGLSLRALMDTSYHPSEAEISASVERAVNVFIKAFSTDKND